MMMSSLGVAVWPILKATCRVVNAMGPLCCQDSGFLMVVAVFGVEADAAQPRERWIELVGG